MSHHIEEKILLVGAGNMAREYTKVLSSMDIVPTVLCRTQATADDFYQQTSIAPTIGGLDNWLTTNQLDATWKVIVTTPVEILGPNLIALLNHGAKDILVEKPGFLSEREGEEIAQLSVRNNAKVHIGYNRRFFASVYAAEDIIEKDGGLQSIQFEFTEWSHVIAPLKKGVGVKENWFLANSTHVVDLAFYLAGQPKDYQFFTKGNLDWHPSASMFSGAGVTEQGILFSYLSNWEAPGRWALELMTKKHRLYLKPMEKLGIQVIGSVAVNDYEIDDSLDVKFKPGIYKMVESFMQGDYSKLVSIQEQLSLYSIYKEMANY